MIELSLSGISVSFKKFTYNKFPRAIIDPYAGIEYSIYGTSIGDGPLVEPKFIWVFSAFVYEQQEELIGALYAEFDFLRRLSPINPPQIRLIDTNQKYQERAPRTRAIAPGSIENMIVGGYVSYFAQFNVWPVKPPDFSDAGIVRVVNLTFQETSKTVRV